jgi:hypothetical protein
VDSNQAILSLTVYNAAGILLFRSGEAVVDAVDQQSADERSRAFAATFVDKYGRPTDRSNASTDASAIRTSTLIEPGAIRTEHFCIRIPEASDYPLQLVAELTWQKYAADFAGAVLGQPIVVPKTVMSRAAMTLSGALRTAQSGPFPH